MATAKVFGDPTGFAIRCAPSGESTPSLAYCCHWLLNGNLIGDVQEPCYLPIWTAALINFKSWQLPRIIASPFTVDEAIIHRIFTTPYETWQADTVAAWDTHRVTLDETQDAWQLMAYSKQGCIVFVGQGLRAPCSAKDIGRIFTVTVDYLSIIATIDACLHYLGQEE